jgi:hypothetical protein
MKLGIGPCRLALWLRLVVSSGGAALGRLWHISGMTAPAETRFGWATSATGCHALADRIQRLEPILLGPNILLANFRPSSLLQ